MKVHVLMGANPVQMFMKITLPYMLFVTGPFLLTQFTGNLNNFNVIFLLTQGNPQSMKLAGECRLYRSFGNMAV